MLVDPAFDEHMAELLLQAKLCWVIALMSTLALAVLALNFRRRATCRESGAPSIRASLRALHESQSALASMEFLMVFLPFLIIVMTVWQLAFMFNAQILVGYSAFTAARSASVMIPASLDTEKEWQLKPQTKKAEKWQNIRQAAIPGVLPISPGDAADAAGALGMATLTKDGAPTSVGTDPAVGARMLLMGAHYGTTGPFSPTRMRRSFIKDMYAQSATEVLINGKNHEKAQNFKGMDTIEVTVNYLFYLNVPYVGKLFQASIEGLYGPLRPYPSIVLTETIHVPLWSRKRAFEPSC